MDGKIMIGRGNGVSVTNNGAQYQHIYKLSSTDIKPRPYAVNGNQHFSASHRPSHQQKKSSKQFLQESSSDCSDSSDERFAAKRRSRLPLSVADAAKFKKMTSVSSSPDSVRVPTKLHSSSQSSTRRGHDPPRFGNSFERRDLGSAGSRTSVSSRDSSGSLSRKERRDALKARVEALRERFCDSSSDDESNSRHTDPKKSLFKYHSDESLNKKSRSARNDRHRKRYSRDGSSIYNNSKQNGADRATEIVSEGSEQVTYPPVWNATVVYQRSSIYNDGPKIAKNGNSHRNEDSSYSSYHSAFENPNECYNLSRHTRRTPHRMRTDGEKTNWKYLVPPKGAMPPHSKPSSSVSNGDSKRKNSHNQEGSDSNSSRQPSRAPTPPPRSVQTKLTVHQPPVVVAEASQKVFEYPPKSPTPLSSKKIDTEHNSHFSGKGSKVYHYTDVSPHSTDIKPPVHCSKTKSYTDCAPPVPQRKCKKECSIQKFVKSFENKYTSKPAYSSDISPTKFPKKQQEVFNTESSKNDDVFVPWINNKDPSSRIISRRASDVSVRRSVADFWKQKDTEARNAATSNLKNSEFAKNLPLNNNNAEVAEPTTWCYNTVYSNYSDDSMQRCKIKRSNSETLQSSRPQSLIYDENSNFAVNGRCAYVSEKCGASTNGANSEHVPPPPPVRMNKKTRRGSSTSSLEHAENLFEELVRQNKEKRKSQLCDAIVELENMYENLNLGDEDLMDRAERRDLPISIQKLRNYDRQASSDTPQDQEDDGLDKTETLDSSDCLIKGRTPRIRRSGVPDKINDDLAYRKNRTSPKREEPTKTMSYLLCSPALTPPIQLNDSHLKSPFSCEPDIVTDDVSYRNFQRANKESQHLQNQKPFGIPIGPVSQASAVNYVQMSPKYDDTRPTFHAKANPDVIRDDMAFRNLRKDTSLAKPPVDFEELDRILRGETLSRKQRRAMKTLSVYAGSGESKYKEDVQEFERAQSLTDLSNDGSKSSEKSEATTNSNKSAQKATSDKPNSVNGNVVPVNQRRGSYIESEGTSTETLTGSRPELSDKVSGYHRESAKSRIISRRASQPELSKSEQSVKRNKASQNVPSRALFEPFKPGSNGGLSSTVSSSGVKSAMTNKTSSVTKSRTSLDHLIESLSEQSVPDVPRCRYSTSDSNSTTGVCKVPENGQHQVNAANNSSPCSDGGQIPPTDLESEATEQKAVVFVTQATDLKSNTAFAVCNTKSKPFYSVVLSSKVKSKEHTESTTDIPISCKPVLLKKSLSVDESICRKSKKLQQSHAAKSEERVDQVFENGVKAACLTMNTETTVTQSSEYYAAKKKRKAFQMRWISRSQNYSQDEEVPSNIEIQEIKSGDEVESQQMEPPPEPVFKVAELVKRASEKLRSQKEKEASQSALKVDGAVSNPDSKRSNEDEELVPMQALQVCKPKLKHIVKHELVINKPKVDNSLNSGPSFGGSTQKPGEGEPLCSRVEEQFETESEEAPILLEPKPVKVMSTGQILRVESPSSSFLEIEKPIFQDARPAKVRPNSVHCWNVNTSEKSNESFGSGLFPIGRSELSISTPELSNAQWPINDTVGQVLPKEDTPLLTTLQEVDKFDAEVKKAKLVVKSERKAQKFQSSLVMPSQAIHLTEVNQIQERSEVQSCISFSEKIMENTEEEEEDKLSRMSLSDKIKLFKKKSEEQNLLQPPLNRRRRQGEQSRFKTQPVTTEEVEIATNKISPKLTPDPRILKSMSMLIAKEIFQKQLNENEDDTKRKGILKQDEPVQKESTRGILKSDSSSDSHEQRDTKSPVKGILKVSDNREKRKEPLKSILKAQDLCLKKGDNSSDESDSDAEMECSGRINQDKLREKDKVNEETERSSPSKTVSVCHQEQDEMTKINNNKNTQVMKTHKSSSSILSSSTLGNSLAKELNKERADRHSHKKTNPAIMRRLQANQRRTDGRLASLQKSQEDGWKERLRTIKSDDPEKEIGIKKSLSEIFESKSKELEAKAKIKEETTPKARPTSIADRLNLLESSKKDWQKRVEKSDAEQYTVAGKMGVSPGNVTPVSQRKRQVPELQIFRSKTDDINRLKSLGAVSLFPISPITPKTEIIKSKSTTNVVLKEESSDSENDENNPASLFMQPMSFNVSSTSSKEECLQINEDSFSSFLLQTAKSSDKLHVEHRTVRAQRKQVTSGNPIRKLASRSDLSYSYREEKNNNAENERKKMKIESMSKGTALANSALAGLASIEDFASVSLRKVDSSENIASSNFLCPYKDKMLLQIKGRRIIQTRIVVPEASSINTGDCFILVTPDVLFQYIGKLSNVIEKSKSADVASVIRSKKDLGYKNLISDVIIIDGESNVSKENEKDFWSLLGLDDAKFVTQKAGPPEDDEIYESSIVSTNKVYKIDDTSLVPCEEYWGSLLNYDMLKPEKVFVFDFGSEMYVWHGKLSPPDQRRISAQLAKELWNQGYDYSKCDINPVYPTSQRESQKCSKERPDWALLGKVNQHMETVLFKEKFFNWPNEDAKTKRRDSSDSDSSDSNSNKITEMVACDAAEMLNTPFPEVDLVLEMSHLGRGLEFHDEKERRFFEIETRGIQIWHAQEFGTEKVCEDSWGQFHSGDTYVVRWHYTVIQTGRALTGGASKHNKVGRDRCAYFFWQGRDSSINEKGACALMTVELDEERGPHVRVIQGKEPPCFLNIFKGSMVIHKNKRNNQNSAKRGEWCLFIVLGEEPSEAMLVEVDCDISCLRSRAVFVLMHTTTCDVYVWYGSKISKTYRTIARTALDNLKSKKPSEMHFCNKSSVTVHREHEGNESDGFFKGIGSSDTKKYFSLISDERLFDYTMRVYRFTSVSGTFSSIEMLCPFRKNENPCAFPIVQADLYKVSQPALFLIDNNSEIFLWQGWYPENNSCPKNRWNKEKLCAMETCMAYCKEKQLEESKAVLISAGHETLEFKNLFPEWIEDWKKEIDDVDCSKPQSVAHLLRKMKKNTYTLEELKQPTLPEGIDPMKLEAYLVDDEFEKVFEMTKEEFYDKPSWRQLELRKAANLF